MQFRPRLTSASGSPWVAMTRLSLTATIAPQPVPQKRHGALVHLTPASPACICACTGMAVPGVAAAAAAADCRMKSRLRIGDLLVHGFQGVGALVDQHGGQHTVDVLDAGDELRHRIGTGGLERDDK